MAILVQNGVKEFNTGQMVRTMKDIGKIINKMEREDSSMWKEMFMKEIGKMIKPMVM